MYILHNWSPQLVTDLSTRLSGVIQVNVHKFTKL